MIINEKCKGAISAYIKENFVYCPGCNKRLHSENHPANVAEITVSQTVYLLLLDSHCLAIFNSDSESHRDILTKRIENRIRKQPDIFRRTLIIRISCSARLLVNGTFKSCRKASTEFSKSPRRVRRF